ncbi:unnamed protein product [Macrosiphum euphorbiae]|uniref:Uncharacterized protein n=1 Tax=Macrosiphum euphorbiae TaxID=13131 RepID=A0AAV0YA62_9HEMI|nr:unnamed protein product [Macrosiphum euphorbiae]
MESDSLHTRKTIHLFGSDGDIKRFSPDGVAFVYSREMRLHLKQILENDTIQWKFRAVGRVEEKWTNQVNVPGCNTHGQAKRCHACFAAIKGICVEAR